MEPVAQDFAGKLYLSIGMLQCRDFRRKPKPMQKFHAATHLCLKLEL